MTKSFEEQVEEWYGGVQMDITKTDAPLLAATTGVANVVYGAYAFAQYNNLAVTLGYLAKFAPQRSGWRVDTAMGGAAGGIAEGGAMPDSVKNTYAEVSAEPQEVVHRFETSTKVELMRGKDDMLGSLDEDYRKGAITHAKKINAQLLGNVTTVAGNNINSIDRVCSSYGEVTNCGDVDANDSDIYGLDRDAAATVHDAVVDENANVDRALTLDLIRDLKADIVGYGGKPSFILTNPDTNSQIESLVETTTRYSLAYDNVAPGANGVNKPGAAAGMEVVKLFGLPVVTDADVVADGTGRIYMLDVNSEDGVPTLGLGLWKRTELIENKNILLHGELNYEFAYYTAAELYCRKFRAQGKIRDLSA